MMGEKMVPGSGKLESLALVTQNLFASSVASAHRRVQEFADYLAREKPDVVALQACLLVISLGLNRQC